MLLPEINIKISFCSVEENSTTKQVSNVQIPVPIDDINQGITFLANQQIPSPVSLEQISQAENKSEIPTPFSQMGANLSLNTGVPEPNMYFAATSQAELPEPQESKKKK